MAKAEKSVALGVELETGQLKASAESGAAALAKLQDTIKSDTKELQSMQRAIKELKAGSGDYTEQVKKLEEAISAKRESIATARSQFIAFGGTMGKAGKGANNLHAQLAELKKTMGGLPGTLGAVVQILERMADAAANNPIKAALVGTGVAMVGLAAKTALATVQLTKYAISQADARRTELLRLEGLTKIRNYYGLAAGSASELQDAIDSVSASSALSRSTIAGLAEQLYKAGFRGENLTAALDAAAIKTSTQGQEQASMWIGYAEAVNRTGGDVTKFAQNVRNQLGGVAQKQMLSATVQAEKLEESYSQLTNGVKIDPLLKARKAFNDLFSQATSSGKALKQLLGLILQPLIDGIAKVTRLAKPFFQGMILSAQELTMATLELADMFGFTFAEEVPDSLGEAEAALQIGRGTFDLFAGTLWAVLTVATLVGAKFTWMALKAIPPLIAQAWASIPALTAQAAALWALAAPFLTAAAFTLLFIAAGYLLWKFIDGIVDLILELKGDFFKNMFGGIKEAWKDLTHWFGGKGTDISDKVQDDLEMHSPSKVFARIGQGIGDGLQEGIDSTAPDVNQSVEHLVDVPKAPAPTGPGTAPGAAAAAGARGTIIIEAINLTGYKDPASAATDFVAELGKALRVVGYQLGTTTTTAGAGA